MNRFMLNLRSLSYTDDSHHDRDTRRSIGMSTPRFVAPDSFLGNIGESLEHQFIDENVVHDEDEVDYSSEAHANALYPPECVAGPSMSGNNPV